MYIITIWYTIKHDNFSITDAAIWYNGIAVTNTKKQLKQESTAIADNWKQLLVEVSRGLSTYSSPIQFQFLNEAGL